MGSLNQLMRQALLAAFLLLPANALGQISAVLAQHDAGLRITGLSTEQRVWLLSDAERVHVAIDGAVSSRGMALDLMADGETLLVQPKFPLLAGTNYAVRLDLHVLEFHAVIATPDADAPAPVLTGFAPSQSIIPANTLRIYLEFSEPMARGHLLESVTLVRSDGSEVENPFLNLETELWDPSQTRATLLFDPGRIKQGVGPNSAAGAPLEQGQHYRLIVRSTMKSAAGARLPRDTTLSFQAGPPERRALNLDAWEVLPPVAGTLTPVSVSFDRIMDTGALRRLMTLNDPQGRRVAGEIATDGGGWTLTPVAPWQAGDYALTVDAELEDVSGNTLSATFDAHPGTMGKRDLAQTRKFRIGG